MISITFISNFMNHHQLCLSDELNDNPNVDYHFIATQNIPEERKKLGYHDMNNIRDYIVCAYSSEVDEKALNLILKSDIVLFGDAPSKYLNERMKLNKITFLYTERLFKFGKHKLLNPLVIYGIYKNYYRYKNKNLYLLSSGYYTYEDFKFLHLFKNKAFRWGYFPEVIKYESADLLKNKRNKILWCGRFLDWKHPEIFIDVCKKYQDSFFEFEMIGTGCEIDNIKQLVLKEKLTNINIIGALSPEDVRKHMEEASIYIFTSDKQEGWGAVLNEAMNSGCAVIANYEIGAVPYLIKDSFNGYIYTNKDELLEKVGLLIEDKQLRDSIATNAYNTIYETWNHKVAANNLVDVSMSLLNKEDGCFIKEGPCSYINGGNN